MRLFMTMAVLDTMWMARHKKELEEEGFRSIGSKGRRPFSKVAMHHRL